MTFAESAVNACEIIQWVYQGNIRQATAVWQSFYEDIRIHSLQQNLNVSRGAFIVIDTVDVLRVYLAGVQSQNNINLCALGFVVTEPEVTSHDVHTYAFRDAIILYEIIESYRNDRLLTVELYGHSAGGMVAEILASILDVAGNYAVRRILTMGSPKCGSARWYVDRPHVQRRRLMAYHDPVPLLPIGRLPSGYALGMAVVLYERGLTGQRSVEVESFVAGSGGVLVVPGEGATAFISEPFAGPNPQLALGAFFAQDSFVLNAHGIDNYLSCCRAIVKQETVDDFMPVENLRLQPELDVRPSTELPPVSIALRTPKLQLVLPLEILPTTLRPTDIVVLRGNDVLLPGGSTITARISWSVKMGNVKLRPALKAKPVRLGGTWCVEWMGTVLNTGPSLSRAKTLSKAINRLSRTWGTQNLINGAAVIAALSAFLQVAPDTTSGTIPPLSVD